MQMTDHEIVQSFKEAKFPGKQITILAELIVVSAGTSSQ